LVNGCGEAEARSEARRTKIGGPKVRAAVGLLRRGQQAPPHQLKDLGSAVSFPSGVWGGAPAAKRFSRILNTQD